MTVGDRESMALRVVFLTSATLALATLYAFYQAGNWFQDSNGQLRLHDFAVFWAAAKRVLAGEAGLIYDRAAHEALQSALTSQPVKQGLAYPYPPDSLLLIWPLGLLSYGAAWLAFALAGLAGWILVLKRIVRDWSLALGMALALGASTQSLLLGQNGFVTAALLCGAMLLLPKHKSWAGIAMGILSLKPHLAAGAFLALLIWREWRALQFALGTVAALVGLTTLVFGPAIWQSFLIGNAAFADYVAAGRFTLIEPLMQSVLALALRWTSWPVAIAVHAGTAVIAICFLALPKRADHRAAALAAAIIMVTPFSYFYDTTMLVGGAAFLLRGARTPLEKAAIGGTALLPGLWFVTGGPIGALTALLVMVLLLNQVRGDDRLPVVG